MLPRSLQTLENQRLELLLAAAKSAAKGNAEAVEALEGKLEDAENKLRGEKYQTAILVAAHNAAQAELRQCASFLQTLNDDLQKVVAASPSQGRSFQPATCCVLHASPPPTQRIILN